MRLFATQRDCSFNAEPVNTLFEVGRAEVLDVAVTLTYLAAMEPHWHKDLPHGTVVYPDRVGLTCEMTIRRISQLHNGVIVATVQDGSDHRSLLILRETGFVIDMGCYAYLSQPPAKKGISQYTDKEIGERVDWIRRLDEQFSSLDRQMPDQLHDEETALTSEMFDRHERDIGLRGHA